MDKQLQTELEAAAFRQLLSHLQQHTEVQNIDLMILADFCRNCLAKWYMAAAIERNVAIDYDTAREKFMECLMRHGRINFKPMQPPSN